MFQSSQLLCASKFSEDVGGNTLQWFLLAFGIKLRPLRVEHKALCDLAVASPSVTSSATTHMSLSHKPS